MRGVTSRNSTASRCAVLIAIPASREEFDAALSRTPLPDYLSEDFGYSVDPHAGWEKYERVAKAAEALIGTARKLGAGVFVRATLEDVTRATARYQYVVVCAHWRGARVTARDLRSNPETIVQRIRQHPALASLQPQSCDEDCVVESLNAVIKDLSLLPSLPKSLLEAAKRTPAIGQVLSRDIIDKALRPDIAPGNCVELFDRLHTPGEFEAALWSGFAGELDLALCRSVSLSTLLDLRRKNRIANLYWDCQVDAAPQLRKIAMTLEMMAANGGGYIETRLSVEEAELRNVRTRMRWEKTLLKYLRPVGLLGSEPIKKSLVKDLEGHRRLTRNLYWICFAIVCAGAFVAVAAVAIDVYRGSSHRTAAIVGAGVTIPVLIGLMRVIVREWSQMDLMLRVIAQSDEATIQLFLQRMLNRFGDGPTSDKPSGGDPDRRRK